MVQRSNKYDVRLNLRLSRRQMDFVIEHGNMLAMSPSEYIRALIDTMAVKVNTGDSTNEDEQADFNNQL